VVTRPIDRLGIGVDLDLGVLAEHDMCLELWKRELTTALEMWKAVQLQRPAGGEGEFAALSRHKAWIFPEVSAPCALCAPTLRCAPGSRLKCGRGLSASERAALP
jgi:hypothetical protein